MKKILIILSFFALIACENLEDLNKNVKDPAVVPGETLFTGAQRRMANQVTSTNVNLNNFRLFAQYWTETTYTDESNYDLTTRTTPDNLWDLFYLNCLKNYDEAAKVIKATPIPAGEDPAVSQNKLAIIEISEVYCWDVLVTTFGDVPYSEALDIENPLPKYDDAKTVYTDLLARLNAAIGKLDAVNASFGAADNLYNGDVESWLRFANSLKLRMGMTIADDDAVAAKAIVEAAASGAILSNSENAKIVYLSAPPNTNPVYIDMVASGRHDFVAANTIVDALNDLQDPRMYLYLSNRVPFSYRADEETGTKMDSIVTEGPGRVYFYPSALGGDSVVFKVPPYTMSVSDSLIDIEHYLGGTYGASNDYLAKAHASLPIQSPTFPATLFDYAEVEFLLAEAVERGFNVGGTAEEHYNKAITASIEDWGGTADDATAYLASPKVNYVTAEGDWRQKIGTQSWIAYYNRGFEAWTQWRRLDYPQLEAPADALTVIPLRYTYPSEEQTLNGDNWKAATTKLGGDVVENRLFWDKF